MSRVSAVAACFTALGAIVASPEAAWPEPRDEAPGGKGNLWSVPDPGPRGQKSDYGSVPDPGPRGQKSDFGSVPDPGPRGQRAGKPDPTMPAERRGLEEAEDSETVLLSLGAARRAIDAFIAVRDGYTGHGIENYDTLEAFVAGTEAGKRLEAEVVTHGFSDITDWNLTIMAVGSAYSAILYDLATDLRQQIAAVRNDPSLDEEMREQLIAGLTELMPSPNNRAVLQALLEDPAYRNKLKLLQEEE